VPLRVLFLTHRLPYAPNRGDRLRAYQLLRTLAASGAEVDLISLAHDAEEASHAADLNGLAASVHVARVPRLRNLTRGAFLLPSQRPLTHALLDAPDITDVIARVRRDRQPDVVLAYCSGMARFALEPALADLPCVVDMVDADSAKWAALAETTPWPKRYVYTREARCLSRFEARAMQHASATLVVNAREREILRRLTPDARILIVENGIDVDAFTPTAAPTEDPTVIFCGVMNYAPNSAGAAWLAREAWPIVRATLPAARLLLVGASPTQDVRALADADRSIAVTGTVPDVRPFLAQSAVAAAPLHTARGIQNKVLEAVAAGLPCVVTSTVADGLPKDVEPACLVADAAQAFADALLALLHQSGRERRALAASASLDRLRWTSRLQQVPDILRDAAARDQAALAVAANA